MRHAISTAIPLCALVALNLFAHYFWVCTVPPGFADDPPRAPGAAQGALWASPRRAASRRALTGGVRWSETESVHVTRAGVTPCRRCGQMRPEVSSLGRARE